MNELPAGFVLDNQAPAAPMVEDDLNATPPRLVIRRAPGQQASVAPTEPADQEQPNAPIKNARQLSDRDRAILTRTILGEAAGEPDEGQRAVAAVILNRLNSGKYGASIPQVVTAKGAFEPWLTPQGRQRMLSYAPDSPEYTRAAQNVDALLSGQTQDPTDGSDHFYAPKAQAALGRDPPKWASGEPAATIGGHQFYAIDNPRPKLAQAATQPARYGSELPPGFVFNETPQTTPADAAPAAATPQTAPKKTFSEKLLDTWPAKLVESAIDAAKLPGDVYSGKVKPDSDEEIGRATNLAMWATPLAPGMRAGEGVAAAPLARKAAPELPAGTRAAATANDLGAPLPVGLASESGTVQAATQAARQIPFVGPKITEAAGRTVKAAGERVNNIADEMAGGVADRATAGANMRGSLQDVIEGNKSRIGDAYKAVDDLLDPAKLSTLPRTKLAYDTIVADRTAAGNASPGAGLENVKNLIDSGATFRGLQRARSDVGNTIQFGEAHPGYNAGDMKRVYAALSGDLQHSVQQTVKQGANPADAAEALRSANATAAPLIELNGTLQKVAGAKADEGVIGALVNAGRDKTGNARLLAQLRSTMPKEEFQQIGGVALSEMGHNSSTGQFSLNKFATEWDKLSPTAKSVLFEQQHAKMLDDVAALGQHLKDADKYANTSNTARATMTGDVLKLGAGAIGGLVAGGAGIGPLVAALSAAGGGYMLAKMLSRPAGAATVAAWSRAALATERGPSPAKLAVFKIATRNLLMNLPPDDKQQAMMALGQSIR